MYMNMYIYIYIYIYVYIYAGANILCPTQRRALMNREKKILFPARPAKRRALLPEPVQISHTHANKHTHTHTHTHTHIHTHTPDNHHWQYRFNLYIHTRKHTHPPTHTHTISIHMYTFIHIDTLSRFPRQKKSAISRACPNFGVYWRCVQ